MRQLLCMLLLCLASECCGQVTFARPQRVLKRRPAHLSPQDEQLQDFIPFSPRIHQLQQRQPPAAIFPSSTPAPAFQPSAAPPSFRQQVSPSVASPSRPLTGSSAGLRDRSQSRFQPTFNDFQQDSFQRGDEDKLRDEDYEDYSDEPDRLSILLAESEFQCNQEDTGYFADNSVNCEIFHYCSQGVKHSWVCPDGNMFHQINLICQPHSSDNICSRSDDFRFVNEYLYQVVNNDSVRPEYADRFYPANYYPGSELDLANVQRTPLSRSRPQPQRQEQRRRIRPAARPFSSPSREPTFSDQASSLDVVGFRQTQAAQSVVRPAQQPFVPRQVAERPGPGFRQNAAAFREPAPVQQRSSEPARPLPPVRPAANPFPHTGSLRPDIRFHGAPAPAARLQERRDSEDFVLGGFQGNVDIHDLASRNSRRF